MTWLYKVASFFAHWHVCHLTPHESFSLGEKVLPISLRTVSDYGAQHCKMMHETRDCYWPVLLWWFFSPLRITFGLNATQIHQRQLPCQPGKVNSVLAMRHGNIGIPFETKSILYPLVCFALSFWTSVKDTTTALREWKWYMVMFLCFAKKVTTVQKAVNLQCHVPEECLHQVFGPGTSAAVSAALHITMLPQRVWLPVCPVDPEHNSLFLARINVFV